MRTPEPPAGYEIREYKPGEVVGEGALYWSSLDSWEPSSFVGKTPRSNDIYCEPIRPRKLRWYDLSKGEQPTVADGDDNGDVLFRWCDSCRVGFYHILSVRDIKKGYWHPIAKFPKPDQEETAAIELLKSRGYSVRRTCDE